MDESQIYETLGLKLPEAETTAGEAQGSAEEAQEVEGGAAEGTPEAQTKEQEVAAPAETEKKEQTKEERARHAQERRRAETAEAVRLAREEERRKADAELIQTLRDAGLMEGEDGKDVKTREDVERYLQTRRRRELDEKLENGTATAADIERLLERKAAAERRHAREEQERQRFLTSIEGEMEEVRKLRPDVKTIADFGKLDKAKEFYDLVMQGESYLGAIQKLYGEPQQQRQQEMQRQQIVNDINGMSHLKGAGKAQGTAEVSLSPEELAAYRLLNPKASDKDIRDHYQRYRKKTDR